MRNKKFCELCDLEIDQEDAIEGWHLSCNGASISKKEDDFFVSQFAETFSSKLNRRFGYTK